MQFTIKTGYHQYQTVSIAEEAVPKSLPPIGTVMIAQMASVIAGGIEANHENNLDADDVAERALRIACSILQGIVRS